MQFESLSFFLTVTFPGGWKCGWSCWRPVPVGTSELLADL